MKKRIENFMGILIIFIVLTASAYYNRLLNYTCTSKKSNFGVEQKENVSDYKIDKSNENHENQSDVHFLNEGEFTIVIDPGHGGLDPGKIGINDELEKNINLEIALKLKEKLEDMNVNVVLTRDDDTQLSSDNDKGWKKTDMRNRVKIINDSKADLCISIHQNSYSSQNVKGAQVFYYSGSENGKKLAEIIQESLKNSLDDGNKRMEKSNDSYYVLLKSECPTVIVECGFLSNWEEATNLKDDYYQDKIADAIINGIVRYINSEE